MKKGISFMLAAMLVFLLQAPVTAAAAEPIDEVRNLIDVYYVDDVPKETLEQETIAEITELLDPHSVYLSKEEYERFTDSVNQELVGIGIVLEEHEEGVQILQTLPESPAEEAGILPGDIITQVDGKSLKGLSVETSVSYITGKEDTSVKITFLQNGEANTVTLERKRISIPNVEYEMLGGNIGYIRLYSFSMDGAEEVQEAIEELQGAKGFILDLRDNGGGYVSTAQDMIGLFPKAETAFQLKERNRAPFVYNPTKQGTLFSKPVHILVNENSASASEMVSASVKEQEAAVLYGQTTYGKGSMQGLFLLSDESVLKLTTAKFLSPNGTAIDGIGVEPNIKTNPGGELVRSHRDHVLQQVPSYNKLPSLEQVEADKVFSITMTTGMNWGQPKSSDVELIHLGGENVEIKLEVVNNRELKVIPAEPLESQETYLLLIHPNWKSTSNLMMEQGAYLEINVK